MIGNKAKNLTFLKNNFKNLVPDFLVFDLQKEIDRDYAGQILFELEQHGLFDKKLAFRVSANVEDGEMASFAGIFESFLDIDLTTTDILSVLEDCKASLYSDRVLSYCKLQGFNPDELKASVIVQRMFYGSYYGVAFAQDNGKIHFSFSSTARSIVDGHEGIELTTDSKKGIDLNAFPKDVPKKVWKGLISNLQKIVALKGKGQDIEWSVSKDSIALLQTRDITTSVDFADATHDAKGVLFDKTNIGENYPGVTLPITYSFIREAYENVYRSFLQIIGVKTSVLDKNYDKFHNMLGYLNGQVFYNLDNWYDGLLRLLPGYEVNKVYFDRMLNPVKGRSDVNTVSVSKRTLILTNWRLLLRLVWNLIFIQNNYRKFERTYGQINQIIKDTDTTSLNDFELIDLHKRTEKEFFRIWGYTVMNDIRLMIFNGMLQGFGKKYLPDNEAFITKSMNNNGDLYSLKPLLKINLIVTAAKYDSLLEKALIESDYTFVFNFLESEPEHPFTIAVADYLDEFGHRFGNELKLENISMHEDKTILFRILTNHLKEGAHIAQDDGHNANVDEIPLSFFRRIQFKYLLKNTVLSIHKREQYRILRSKTFRIARKNFLELGRRLKERGFISHEQDIFYLYKEELFGVCSFNMLPDDISLLIEKRKEEFAEYEQQELPRALRARLEDGKFTYTPLVDTAEGEILTGKVVSGGPIVRGECVVMENLDMSVDLKGKILVTSKTDPGWTVLFPLVTAIICEFGNSLSHASIVSRELKKVCIVGVKDVTKTLKTGDMIEIDPITGVIKIIEK